jgi:hypothetical protein
VTFGLIVIAKALFAEAGLSHGPLVGAVKPTAVKIWVRTSEPASVQIAYSTSPQFDGSSFSTTVTTPSVIQTLPQINYSPLIKTLVYYVLDKIIETTI